MMAVSAFENAGRTGTTSARTGSGLREETGMALTTGTSSLWLKLRIVEDFHSEDGPLLKKRKVLWTSHKPAFSSSLRR